jgi:glycosyltransferase involved in cell wall biosynthesis
LHFDPASVRRYVEENFSIERMAREYAELYREAIAARGAASAA